MMLANLEIKGSLSFFFHKGFPIFAAENTILHLNFSNDCFSCFIVSSKGRAEFQGRQICFVLGKQQK